MTVVDLTDRFDRALPIADAVLWEGYVLYPYRASAAKNRHRFNWGVVGPAEEPTMSATVFVENGFGSIACRVRFLHLVTRDDGWDEAVPVAIDFTIDVTAGPQPDGARTVRHPFSVSGGDEIDAEAGVARHRRQLDGVATVRLLPHGDHHRVEVEIENLAGDDRSGRDEALRVSFVGTHVMLATDGDRFVSMLEPPDGLAEAVAAVRQHRLWPVLVGPEPLRDLVLLSPVILYDYPGVAPESVGDFYDGTEIDEMLALRVHTLTDEEKAEARALDPRARAIIDRHDELDEATMARLHGTIRAADPADPTPSADVGVPEWGAEGDADGSGAVDPMPEWSDPGPQQALVGGVWIHPGSKVELRPSKRADVHDMFLVGRLATVGPIVHDVDGDIHVAVTVDDDPAAELFEAQRRYLYFAPDELSIPNELPGHG